MANRIYSDHINRGIVVALNAWWESDELEYGLNHTGTKVAIVDQERLDRIVEMTA